MFDLDFLLTYATSHGYTQLFLLILANLVLGVAQAIRDKAFSVAHLSDFASKYGWQLVVFGVADAILKSDPLTTLLLGVFTASLSAGVLEKIVAFVPSLEGKLPTTLFDNRKK